VRHSQSAKRWDCSENNSHHQLAHFAQFYDLGQHLQLKPFLVFLVFRSYFCCQPLWMFIEGGAFWGSAFCCLLTVLWLQRLAAFLSFWTICCQHMDMNGCRAGKTWISFGPGTHSLSVILFSRIVRNNNGWPNNKGDAPENAKNLIRLRVLLIIPCQSSSFPSVSSLWPVVNIDDSGAALGLRPPFRLLAPATPDWFTALVAHCFLRFKMTAKMFYGRLGRQLSSSRNNKVAWPWKWPNGGHTVKGIPLLFLGPGNRHH